MTTGDPPGGRTWSSRTSTARSSLPSVWCRGGHARASPGCWPPESPSCRAPAGWCTRPGPWWPSLGLTSGLMVCYQGAVVVDIAGGPWLYHRPIGHEDAVAVVRHVRALGRHLNAHVDDRFCVEELDEWAELYASYAEVGVEVVPDLEALVREREPTKFTIMTQPDDALALLPGLQARWRGPALRHPVAAARHRGDDRRARPRRRHWTGSCGDLGLDPARRWPAATVATTSTCSAGLDLRWRWRRRRRR